MRTILACVALLAGIAQAHPADLDSIKDAVPAIPDRPISWMGVTFYGTIDVGYAYVHNGLPPSGAFYDGAATNALTAPFNRSNISALNNNALTLSNIGIKIEEQLGAGFLAIGRLETQFNPISGELGDACASMERLNGRSIDTFNNFADGSRCGQAFNNLAYAGISHPVFGTLTAGRQTNLVADGMAAYDPMALSSAFSLIGYAGSFSAGIGDGELPRWDNAVKYIVNFGSFHAGGMYSEGGSDTPILEDAYGANVGVTYAGLSIDGFYTKENGSVNLRRLGLGTGAFGTSSTPTSPTCNADLGNCPSFLLGTITNNEAWDVMAKYSFSVPGFFSEPAVSTKDAPCGGLKDEPCAPANAKLTFYGGYQFAEISNPDHRQSFWSGGTTIGGYKFIMPTLALFPTLGATAQAEFPFYTDRTLETAWAGTSYEDGPWRLVAAYYYAHQNSFLPGSVTAPGAAGAPCAVSATGRSSTNCAGDYNQVSFLADYTVNRHFDVYAGVTYSDISGGLAGNYIEDNTWAFASGVRVKW